MAMVASDPKRLVQPCKRLDPITLRRSFLPESELLLLAEAAPLGIGENSGSVEMDLGRLARIGEIRRPKVSIRATPYFRMISRCAEV